MASRDRGAAARRPRARNERCADHARCSRDEAGMVTAETAVVLPVLVLVLLLAVSVLSAVSAQLRCTDAAGQVARSVARGDAEPMAVARGRQLAPAGAVVAVHRSQDEVTVVVTAPAPGLVGLAARVPVPHLRSSAVVLVEQ